MKIIFSLLMFPVFFTAPFIGLMTAFVYYHIRNGCSIPSSETLSHIYMCILHLCTAIGLLGGGLLFLYCAAMCIAGFIIKSWYRAAVAGGMCFGMGYCVWFLNSVVL